MAAVWKLPVVFICENNQYGMSMSVERGQSAPPRSPTAPWPMASPANVSTAWMCSPSTRPPSKRSPMPVAATARPARTVTYRYKGHSKSDKQLYRTKEEVKAWQERDPIMRFPDLADGAWLPVRSRRRGNRGAGAKPHRRSDRVRRRRPRAFGRTPDRRCLLRGAPRSRPTPSTSLPAWASETLRRPDAHQSRRPAAARSTYSRGAARGHDPGPGRRRQGLSSSAKTSASMAARLA